MGGLSRVGSDVFADHWSAKMVADSAGRVRKRGQEGSFESPAFFPRARLAVSSSHRAALFALQSVQCLLPVLAAAKPELEERNGAPELFLSLSLSAPTLLVGFTSVP